jgi:hypothetical protein
MCVCVCAAVSSRGGAAKSHGGRMQCLVLRRPHLTGQLNTVW